MYFQDVILSLHKFWARKGCVLVQPYDLEVGAGTFHPTTLLKTLGPEPWNVAYVQPSRRPTDGRYGDNPNRLQHYYQYQVILKPSPFDVQKQYLQSLKVLGLLLLVHPDWAGKSGLMAWKLHSSPISRWPAVLNSIRSLWSLHTDWNVSPCICRG